MDVAEKKVDIVRWALQALTALLLGAVTFYGSTVVRAVDKLHEDVQSIDKRVTSIEANRYTVQDARDDVGGMTDKINDIRVEGASIQATQVRILKEIESVNRLVEQLVRSQKSGEYNSSRR